MLESLQEVQPVSSQRSFFDEKAAHWDQINHVHPDKITFLLDKLNLQPTDRILDVGTGTGVLIPFLEKASPAGQILGVDISPEMISEARKKFPSRKNVAFRVMNIETDALTDKFDKVILFSVFPHIEKKINTITRLMHHLKPGGELMIAHDQSRDFLNKLHTAKDDRLQRALLLSAENQKKRFEEIGLFVKEAFENDQYYYLILQNQDTK
ncbi:MAG: class I SAM-dependent methyltransferase [Bacteroidales bacterium]